MIGALGYHDVFVNVGYGWTNDNSLMTTKIGYEFMTVLPGARISLVNYTDFNKNQICILPEIGLTYASLIYIMYGYAIKLSRDNYFHAKGHLINVGLMVPLYFREDKRLIWNSRKSPSSGES